jgi:hypothetical protein
VKQCELMTLWGLDYRNWLVVKDTPERMVVVHRHSEKQMRIIPK